LKQIEYEKAIEAIGVFDPARFPKSTYALLRRLGAALATASSIEVNPRFADFVTLLAIVVRTRIAQRRAQMPDAPAGPLTERITIGNPRIPTDILAACHFEVIHKADTTIEVLIGEWSPEWIPFRPARCPIAPVLLKESRRPAETCDADPFLKTLGREHYLSPALQEAMRAVVTAPRGSTLIVNYPTGSGKSLLAQVPALLSPGALSVVIVPTIALCIDQERALRAYGGPNPVPHDTAFYGSTTKMADRKKAILTRIHNGTQRIVFASPESVCGNLFSSLWKSASATAGRGRLEWLVIDEAHIVEQWGHSFRPAFQQLAGVRRGLMRESGEEKFRTLLMSATLTAQTIRTLKSRFSEPGKCACISAVRIRPENSSWFVKCDCEKVRKERTFDAIHNLPKPLIAYTTKVADANAIHDQLKAGGFRRIALFTGYTGDQERARIVQKFRDEDVDIVVATSAFGMGIDADVRSVVHSCIPESFDRFYQEIGRAGRDGSACISLMIYSAESRCTAQGMAKNPTIGMKRGLARWRKMHNDMTRHEETDLFELSVNQGPYPNARHEQWDEHTLNLLASAGVVAFDATPPAKSQADSAEGDSVNPDRRVIEVLVNDPISEATWNDRVEPIRKAQVDSSKHQLKLMIRCLNGEECVAEIAKCAYASADANTPIRIVATCGGCKRCQPADPFNLETVCKLPIPPQPWIYDFSSQSATLQELFPNAGRHVRMVFFRNAEWGTNLRAMRDISAWAIRIGIRFVVAPPNVLSELDLPIGQGSVMTSVDWPTVERVPVVPAMQIIPKGFVYTDRFREGLTGGSLAPRLLLVDESTLDSEGRYVRTLAPFDAIDARDLRTLYGIGVS